MYVNIDSKQDVYWILNGMDFLKMPLDKLAAKIFQKTEIQTVILRCLVGLKLNWIKSYGIILVQIKKFHAWKCIISGNVPI